MDPNKDVVIAIRKVNASKQHHYEKITWKEIGKKIVPLYVMTSILMYINLNRSVSDTFPAVFFSLLLGLSTQLTISRTGFSFFRHQDLKKSNVLSQSDEVVMKQLHLNVALYGLTTIFGFISVGFLEGQHEINPAIVNILKGFWSGMHVGTVIEILRLFKHERDAFYNDITYVQPKLSR